MADGPPLKRKFKETNEFFVIRAKGESVKFPKGQAFDGRDFSKAKGWYESGNRLALRDDGVARGSMSVEITSTTFYSDNDFKETRERSDKCKCILAS